MLYFHKVYGFGEISILMAFERIIVKSLALNHINHLTFNVSPNIWKTLNICWVRKKGDVQLISNYHPFLLSEAYNLGVYKRPCKASLMELFC